MVYLFLHLVLASVPQGFWSGPCTLSPPYQGISEFRGSLEVNPIPGGHQWKLTYDFDGRRPTEVRDYELLRKGDKLVIDEKNGLVLEASLHGDTLYSAFNINGLTIPARYEFGEGTVFVEMPTLIPSSKTCLTGNPRLCAQSLAVRSMQRCRFQ